MFGPLFYSTLVVAVLVAIYDVVLNAPAWLDGISREIGERREVASLAEAVRSADASVRDGAGRRLITKGRGVYGPILRDAARDPRGEVRAQAYHFLFDGGGEPSEMVSLLVAAAGDAHEHVRLAAAMGLGRLARSELMPSPARWRSGTPGGLTPAQRDEALRALRRLIRDPSSLVRAEAAGPLGLFGPDPAIVADLTAAVGDDEHAVRFAAAQALAKAGGPDHPAAAAALLAIAASPEALPDRQEAVRAIGTMSEAVQDRAVAALVNLLSRGERDILPDVIACLPEVGPRAKAAVPALEALLDRGDPGLRAGAAMAIVTIESPDESRALQRGASGAMGRSMMAAGGGMVGGGMMGGAANPAAGRQMTPRALAALALVAGDTAVALEFRRRPLA
jgi:HEAT repeat protein